MKIGIILIHGIGDQKEDWATCLQKELSTRTMKILGKILGDKSPKYSSEVLLIKSVFWQDIVGKSQTQLMEIMGTFKIQKKENLFGKFVNKCIREPIQSLRSEIVAKYMGDIIGYLTKEAKLKIQSKITSELVNIINDTTESDDKIPLTIVSHSLGTVIGSDYIYDECKKREDKTLHDKMQLFNFFTVGSPLALFSMQCGGIEHFRTPIHMENEKGRWINILDEDDFVAMPLKPLNDEYNEAVFKDKFVNSGFWANAHTDYFKKSEAPDIISSKLALDWIVFNKKMGPDQLESLAQKYDEGLNII